MRLAEFSVKNYRSISDAKKLSFSRGTVFVGPNNEGKSNLLRALATGMKILVHGKRTFRTSSGSPRTTFRAIDYYKYERDFPVDLQERGSQAKTIITLTFELDDDEIEEFKTELGTNLNGQLPIKMTLDRSNCDVKVAKQGPGGASLSRKSARVANFVSSRLDFDYIPAVRTAKRSEDIVSRLVSSELAVLEHDPKYTKAIKKISDLQRPILDKVEQSLETTLQQFLPQVTSVHIEAQLEHRLRAMRQCRIYIDDGTKTELSSKGDGIQSLSAIGIMRHASQSRSKGKHLVLAVEEPESHLHPKSQHELRSVIADLAKEHQVVLATHCPLFVDRSFIRSNIVVQNNTARQAKDINEIRNLLGVRSSDNLQSAEIALLCEGDDDKILLESYLANASSQIQKALNTHRLVIESTKGAGNLSHRISLFRSHICRIRCVLDDDDAGRSAYEEAERAGYISVSEVNFLTKQGKTDSELEDLLDQKVVNKFILDEYGVTMIDSNRLKQKKWSSYAEICFKQAGKPWTKSIKNKVKYELAAHMATRGKQAFDKANISPLTSLKQSLESDLSLQ